jgi:hypothetical protein
MLSAGDGHCTSRRRTSGIGALNGAFMLDDVPGFAGAPGRLNFAFGIPRS